MCYPIRGGHATRETNWFSETTLFPLLPSTTRRVHYIQYLLYPSSNLSLSEAGRREGGKEKTLSFTGQDRTERDYRPVTAAIANVSRTAFRARRGGRGRGGARNLEEEGPVRAERPRISSSSSSVARFPTGRNLVNTRSPPTVSRTHAHTSPDAGLRKARWTPPDAREARSSVSWRYCDRRATIALLDSGFHLAEPLDDFQPVSSRFIPGS